MSDALAGDPLAIDADAPVAAAPAPLRHALRLIDRLGRLDGWIGAGCLVALTLLMLAEIIVRALSSVLPFVPADIPVAWEWSSYLMAATFTFGAAMTLRAGGHIRVNLLLSRLGPKPRQALEFGCSLVAAIFTLYFSWGMIVFAWSSWSRGQTALSSDTPVWIPQAVIAFGIVLLALQFVARCIQAALGLPVEDHRLKVASVAE